MPIYTINGNIRTNTAAGWAADATVYTAKTILVTTDAYWGSTDQRKFKLADGVQTWSNLDYPPFEVATDTLSEVLTAGNSTGGLDIVSPDGEQYVRITDTIAELYSNGGLNGAFAGVNAVDGQTLMEGGDNSNDGNVVVNTTHSRIQHTALINLDAPAVRLTQETASRVAILDASKDIVGADTATYPSLTELSYVKGATSAIQTQIDSKSCVEFMFGTTTVYSPADSTTYYFTFQTNLIINTTATLRQFKGVDKTVFSFGVYVDPQGTLGSNEDVTFNLRNITDGVSSLLGTLDFTVRGEMVLMDVATPILMSSSKYYSIEMVTPAWATNPTSVATLGKIICR